MVGYFLFLLFGLLTNIVDSGAHPTHLSVGQGSLSQH